MEDVGSLPLIATALGLAVAAWTWRRERRGAGLLGTRSAAPLPDTRSALLVAFVLWALATTVVARLVLPHVAAPPLRMLWVSLVHVIVAAVILRAASSGPAPSLRPGASLLAGVLGGLATYALVFVVSLALLAAYAAAGASVPEQNVVGILKAAGPEGRVVMIMSAVVLAPFAEEVFYRGVLLPALARWMPVRAALLLQALIFGFSHFWQTPAAWPLTLAIAVVGYGTGWIYVRTGSLRAAIVLHATFNALQIGLLFAAP